MENDLEQLKANTDMQCKILLSNSQIISRFVKCFVDEAKKLTLYEIESCICATEVKNSNKHNIPIHGENTYVYKDNGDGYVNFDILFKFDFPQSNKKEVRVFLNLEAQNNTYPGYALITRGIVYCAMMISRQYNTEFNSDTYSNLKKVYSIWFMPQASKKKDGLIRKYAIDESILQGNIHLQNKKQNYDKMEVIEIYTSNVIPNKEYQLHKEKENLINSLKILFSKTLDKTTKIEKLKEFGFTIDSNLEKEVKKDV